MKVRNPPRKGQVPIGYRPLTGLPRDEQGNLILEYVYASEVRRLEFIDEATPFTEDMFDAVMVNRKNGELYR